MKNSNQKVMQTYGKFFNRPKMENRIVDKWSKDLWRNCYLTRFTSIYSVAERFSTTGLIWFTFLTE
jgi:hypothetical protein